MFMYFIDGPCGSEIVDSLHEDTLLQSHTHSEEAVSNGNHQLVVHATQNSGIYNLVFLCYVPHFISLL